MSERFRTIDRNRKHSCGRQSSRSSKNLTLTAVESFRNLTGQQTQKKITEKRISLDLIQFQTGGVRKS